MLVLPGGRASRTMAASLQQSGIAPEPMSQATAPDAMSIPSIKHGAPEAARDHAPCSGKGRHSSSLRGHRFGFILGSVGALARALQPHCTGANSAFVVFVRPPLGSGGVRFARRLYVIWHVRRPNGRRRPRRARPTRAHPGFRSGLRACPSNARATAATASPARACS
jgi:hypothetical protein